MGFLAKHFNLTRYVQQNNNYVVFEDYFDNGNQSDSQTMSKRNSVTSESNSAGDGMQMSRSSSFGASHYMNPGSQQHTLSNGWNQKATVYGNGQMGAYCKNIDGSFNMNTTKVNDNCQPNRTTANTFNTVASSLQ